MTDHRIVMLGTDTDVGKTWVGTRVIADLRAKGVSVGVFKPFESGALRDDGQMRPQDAEALAAAAGISDLAIVVPWVLPLPVTPADELERLAIDVSVDDVATAAERAGQGHDLLLVETAGGVRSPIIGTVCSGELAARLGPKAVLVADHGLGAISRTSCALDAAHADGAEVVAVYLNDMGSGGLAWDHNAAWIRRLHPHTPVLGTIAELAALLEAVPRSC